MVVTVDPTRSRWRRRAAGSPVPLVIAKRLGQLVLVLLGVSFLTFVMLNLLPGDPALAVLGDDASPEAVEAFRVENDLNRPLLTRYLSWVQGAATGDLGNSYRNDQDVLATILDRAPVSLELVVLAQVLALGVAIPAALFAVWKRNTVADHAVSIVAFAGLAVPSFLLAFVLILVFAVQLQWFPASGYTRLSESIPGNLHSAFLPSATIALAECAVYTRLLRSEMIETMSQEFVTTAYGKGLPTRRIFVSHVLRNSLFALITVVGVNVGTLLGGAVITETIFAIPGVGRLLIDSITQRDLMMVQGVVLFTAATYVVLNLVIDLLYTVIDPRIRHGRSAA